MENSQILFEMLKKVDEKLDSHTDILARLEVNVEKNREDIAHHIARTDLLEEQVELNKKLLEKRIDILEEPGIAKKFLSSKFLQITGIASAIFGLIKFLEYLKSLV